MNPDIHYQVSISPKSHLFEVSCSIKNPDPRGQRLAMPNWIPGSYKIRDFAKQVVSLRAFCEEQPVQVSMLDKSTWMCEPCSGPLIIFYEIYAYDLTPRGAYIDNQQAFLNGSRVFIQVLGQDHLPCTLEVKKTR